MALVRRSVAIGRAQVPVIPSQPGTGVAAPAPVAPVVPGQEMAAAVPSLPARGWATMAALGLAGVGTIGAWNINVMMAPSPFQIGDTFSTFGALFVFSAAVERVLEPFSRWMPGRKEQDLYERAVADLENGVPGACRPRRITRPPSTRLGRPVACSCGASPPCSRRCCPRRPASICSGCWRLNRVGTASHPGPTPSSRVSSSAAARNPCTTSSKGSSAVSLTQTPL